jgi:tetratricopeptide (TPR) repeat protein
MDEAESILDKAVDYFKESYELMELKAALLSQSGNEAAFVAFLDKMKTAFPDNADVYLKKGQYYLAKKQYTAARSELEQAMKYSTEPYRPLKMIIDSYLVEGNAQHATDRLNSRLTQDGNDAMALQLLGRVKFSEKQIEEAREKFIQAINARKGWLVPYLNLASTYLSESNTARAIEIYHQAIENVDNASPARLQLASIYEKQGKRGDAISQYKEILKEEPTHLLVANNLASLMMDDNPGPADIDLALDLTKSFAKMQQPAFLDTLGWVYVKAGRYPEAVSVLRQAVDKAPNVAVFKYHLGVALNSDGKADEARKYLLEAVNSEQDFIGKNEASKLVGS